MGIQSGFGGIPNLNKGLAWGSGILYNFSKPQQHYQHWHH